MAPAIHAAQHERAGRELSLPSRPALPPACKQEQQPAATAILHGLADRTVPQAQATAASPRKPLAGIHAAMRADEMLKRVVKAVQKALRE